MATKPKTRKASFTVLGSDYDLTNYVVAPYIPRGAVIAWLRGFVNGTADQTMAKVSDTSFKQAVQRVAGTADKVNGKMGKRGKPTTKWVYSSDSFDKAVAILADKGVGFVRMASQTDDDDKVIVLNRTATVHTSN